MHGRRGTFAHGYGGKFGVQDVKDKSAVGFEAPTDAKTV
jgi:hypothetical protein